MAGAVPGFSLFSKMMRPRKRKPDSACSLSFDFQIQKISLNEGKSLLTA